MSSKSVINYMEVNELILIALGTMVSVIAFFLKKESVRVERIACQLRKMEIDLAKNNARDAERWEQTQKLLEDRRNDVHTIYEKLNK